MQPLVSVVIPTHNRLELLKLAIKSVLNQTYSNLELIIVNDNSLDGTEFFLENLVAKLSIPVKIIHNKDSQGGAISRNIALAEATGKYISFLDDDDQWEKEKTSTQVTFLLENEEYAVVSCAYINETLNSSTVIKPVKSICNLEDLKLHNHIGSFSFGMVRAEAAEEIRIAPHLTSCQDWYYWYKVIERSRHPAYIINEPLVRYNNKRKVGISTGGISKLNGHIAFYKLIKNDLNKVQKNKQLYTIYNWCIQNLDLSFFDKIKLVTAMLQSSQKAKLLNLSILIKSLYGIAKVNRNGDQLSKTKLDIMLNE